MNVIQLIDQEPGTMWWQSDIQTEYKLAVLRVAVWTNDIVSFHKPALTIYDRNFFEPQDAKIALRGYGKSVTNNFKAWYENREQQNCFPPGNTDFSFLEIDTHMPLGMYLGQLALMRVGNNRIEVLAKFLLRNQVGWVHFQSKSELSPLLIS